MTEQPSEGNRLKCSFCAKKQDQVKKLIAGPGVYVCDECVDLCNEILMEEGFAAAPRTHAAGSDDSRRLKDARNDILCAAMKTEFWTVKRVVDDSTGIQVFIQNQPFGATIEEKVLYATALEDLVENKCLQQSSNQTYQVTWRGFIEFRRAEKQPAGAAVDEGILSSKRKKPKKRSPLY